MPFRLLVSSVFFSVLAIYGSAGAAIHPQNDPSVVDSMEYEVYSNSMNFFTATQASTASVEGLVNSIGTEYSKRFSSGRSVLTPKSRDEFIAKQSGLIAKLKREGKMKRSIRVLNSFRSSLVYTASIVQENGRFVGIVIEKSKYDNKDDQAGLWIYSVSQLKRGRSLFNSGGVDFIAVRSGSMSAENGGEIYVKYPTNVKSNTFGETGISVVKSPTGEFNFFTLNRSAFSQIMLNIWVNPFDGPNYGISRVVIR
jgi:hypothetical protein